MNNTVKKLRSVKQEETVRGWIRRPPNKLETEAADTIERLEYKIEELTKKINEGGSK